MATRLQNVTERTQAFGGQAIDKVRELPQEIPRQITKAFNYMLGRGFIGMALFATALLSGGNTILATWVAVPLLTGFQAFMDYRKEQNSKHHLLEEFREEVASVLGKAPEDVDIKDLQAVAEGDPKRGIPANPVLDEEWDRIGRKRTTQFITTAVSGLAALTFIQMPLFSHGGEVGLTLIDEVSTWVDSAKGAISGLFAEGTMLNSIVANSFTYTGITLSASMVLRAANEALDFVTFHALGLAGKTTHDHIDEISKQLDNGKLITKEQVLGVFVSANKDLAEDIRTTFGKDYEKLGWQKQQAAVAKFGPQYNVYELAYMLNFQVIKPQELAFAAIGKESGVKPKDQYSEALESVEHEMAQEKAKETEKTAEKPKQSFVDRFAAHGPAEKGTFLERVSQDEMHAAELAHGRS